MRLDSEINRAAERPHHERLGQAGHADEQAMAAREQRHEHLVQHLALADDDLADFGENFFVRIFEAGDGGQRIFFRRGGRRRGFNNFIMCGKYKFHVAEREDCAVLQIERFHLLAVRENSIAAAGGDVEAVAVA